VDPLGVRLSRALMNAQAGGFLAMPPGLDGSSGLGIAGITGIARRRRWLAVVTATAPEIPGGEVYFVTLADGSIVVDEDVPDGALAPLAEAVERSIPPPYQAEAARQEGDVWCVGADPVAIAILPATFEGDQIEQSSYGGQQTCAVDGAPHDILPELAQIGSQRGVDYAISAERLDETTWVVHSEPL
jgi:hypothetical protein